MIEWRDTMKTEQNKQNKTVTIARLAVLGEVLDIKERIEKKER